MTKFTWEKNLINDPVAPRGYTNELKYAVRQRIDQMPNKTRNNLPAFARVVVLLSAFVLVLMLAANTSILDDRKREQINQASSPSDGITFVSDVPLYPSLKKQGIMYSTSTGPVSIDETKAFYDSNMPSFGWTKTGDYKGINGNIVWKMTSWTKDKREIVISIYYYPSEQRIDVRFEDPERKPIQISK